MDGLDVRYERCNSVVGRVIEGNVFLLDERGKRIHNLDRLGVFIWGLLGEVCTFGEIARKVSHKFHLSEKDAQADAREFLQELVEKGIVHPLDGDLQQVI